MGSRLGLTPKSDRQVQVRMAARHPSVHVNQDKGKSLRLLLYGQVRVQSGGPERTELRTFRWEVQL